MTTDLQLKPLTSEEVNTIYEKCLDFLSKKGVRTEHPQALKMLDKAGAWVDYDNQLVRFSRDIIEAALHSVPSEILMAGSHEANDIRIAYPRQRLYISTATGNVSYLEPETNAYCDVDIAYVKEWAQLVGVLDEIDALFFPFPKDVPQPTADIHALKATLENSPKHIIIQPYSFDSLNYLFELAIAVAGSQEALKRRPIISMVSCATSPLIFQSLDMEALILAARYGVPIYAAALPSAGGTSPITIAGTVLQNGIETLASLVMSQLLQPGTPYIANPVAFTLDMSSGNTVIASVEAELCQAANTQFVKEAFKVPTAPFGFATDSVVPDGQSILERLTLGLLVSTAGADIIAEAGQLGAGLICSPVQLIIDDTIASILKRVTSGVKVDDDTLAWKEILETKPGGYYLERVHTLKHCREALHLSLIQKQSRELWTQGGSKDLCARALDKYRELKGKLQPIPLPAEIQGELTRIVKRADEQLTK
jgi:trimethylamine:corrinoid methyltransferase-like protein